MLPTTARLYSRIHVGPRFHDAAPGIRKHNVSLLIALMAALALTIALFQLRSAALEWPGQSETQTGVNGVQLAAPRVPDRPVEALERIDLSVVVRNPGTRPIANVVLELTVLRPDGSTALVARQSHISLQTNDSRAIYWAWRVPAQLPSGEYAVAVRAFDANGRSLDAEKPVTAALRIVGRGD